MRSSHLTIITGFKGGPTGSFLITHANDAIVVFGVSTDNGTPSPHTFVAVEYLKGIGEVFVKDLINVVVFAAMVAAAAAGKGRDGTARIDNDRLSLGWIGAAPQIDVVCPVSLVESADLLGS